MIVNKIKKAYSFYKMHGSKAFFRRVKQEFLKNKLLPTKEKELDGLILRRYVDDTLRVASQKVNEQSSYVPKALDSLEGAKLPVKVVAFYLPQFHPFEENNEWWGKGFTEWTNVSKARPQYLGHYQPHLPGELGFYDLRLPSVMHDQIKLAKQYGVQGFCFHHYWFGGKRLMETPVNNFLKDKTMDIQFCLCWANENWSRRWDGSEDDILIAQSHSPEDDIAFLDDILPALKDERYIRIDGKPLLIVYRASLLPDAKATVKRWRAHALKNGLPGLHLVVARSFDITDPRPYDFDAAVEFPPHQVSPTEISKECEIINLDYKGCIYDYAELAMKYGSIVNDNFINYKTVMPSWDNEARKPGRGHTFHGATPELYARWLKEAVEKTAQRENSDNRIVFINAWNEWAEGAHLEPDRKYGYAYLHATANVLRNSREAEVEPLIKVYNNEFQKKSDVAIVLHIYYEDVGLDIVERLSKYQNQIDLIVTIRKDFSKCTLMKIHQLFKNSYFIITENKGRDILPFLKAYTFIEKANYKYLCKIHTKKSLHRKDGDVWRERMLSELLSDDFQATSLLKKNDNLGLIVPKESKIDLSVTEINIDNRFWLEYLFKKMGRIDLLGNYKTYFPAGSMYWARVSALKGINKLVNEDQFELEAGQLDGTLAHAIERIIGILVENNGFYVKEIK